MQTYEIVIMTISLITISVVFLGCAYRDYSRGHRWFNC